MHNVTAITLNCHAKRSPFVPTAVNALDCTSLLAELDDMASRWSSNVRLSLSEQELALYSSLRLALREQGHYDCRIVRSAHGCGQYVVECDPV